MPPCSNARSEIRPPPLRSAFPALLLATTAGLGAPPAEAQTVYHPDPGVYAMASLDRHFFHHREARWWGGVGVRFPARTAVHVRVARGEDVAPGNPLPVTYIGQTMIAVGVSHLVESDERAGVLLRGSVRLTVADSSEGVTVPSADRATFRGGPRITDHAVRVEAHLAREVEFLGRTVYPRLGAAAELVTRREATLWHSPDGPVGTMGGGTELGIAVRAAVGFILPLTGEWLLVVEPRVDAVPGYWFIPSFTPGLGISVNF